MNKIPFLHYKKTKKDLINSYFIALIPLLIFGIYKNGILLYQNDLINFSKIFIPIYFYIISIIISIFISFIYKENIKENILISLLLSASISINTSMLIYPILLFIGLFISKYIYKRFKITFNTSSFTRLLLILSLLINSYSYLNIGEKLDKFNYNLLDIFIGHGIGGIATTSALILIFSLIVLALNKFYKKIIPIIASLTYILIIFIYIILFNNYDYLDLLLNGTVYFSFIFIAPDLYITPVSTKGMIIYALIIGILTSIISIIFNIYEAGYVSIFITSLLIPLINKIINKVYIYNAKMN